MTIRSDEAIARLLTRAVRAGHIWCAAGLWENSGGRGEARVGRRALGAGGDVNASTLFDLASLTKVLATTTLTLVARRRGLLRWDSEVTHLVPGVSGGSRLGRTTVAELVTHTSGLPAWRPLYALTGGRRSELVSALAQIEFEPLPEHSSRYSCLGFIVLGLALQQCFSMPLDVAFTEVVTRPLGIGRELHFGPPQSSDVAGASAYPATEVELCHSGGYDSRWLVESLDEGLRPDDGNARFLGGVAGNAGLFGTARAVTAVAREYLRSGGVVLTPADSDTAARLARTRGLGDRAVGWDLPGPDGGSAGPALGADALGHTGFTGTSLWIDRERDAVYVLLANRVHPGHRGADLRGLRRRFHSLAAASLVTS